MNEPKKQHYVPQCYLKEFIDPNTPQNQEPYVWIFDKKGKNKKRKAPHNILVSTDLYTLELKSGGKDYSIEKTLSALEGEYARVFREKISKQIPLTNEEYVVLCAFVSTMMQRTLRSKANAERFIDEMIQMTAQFESKGEMTNSRLKELLEYKKDTHKLGVFKMLPDIAELLFKMNVAFLVSDDGVPFITSDDPVNLFNPDLQWQKFYSPGLMQKKIEITMSLSPKILVCFSWSNLRGYAKYDKRRVTDTNRMTVNQAHEYIISNSQKTKLIWFSRYPLDFFFLLRILKHQLFLLKRKFITRKLYGKRR